MDFNSISRDVASSFLPPKDEVKWNAGNLQVIELSTRQKVEHCVIELFRTIANLGAFTVMAALNLPSYTFHCIRSACSSEMPAAAALPDYSAEAFAATMPQDRGFSDSHFQTGGLGTSSSATPLAGISTWEKWLNPAHIEGGEQNYKEFFTDVLSNPAPFINLLKDMGSTAYRFSLEWSVMQPTQDGAYNQEAIAAYKNFIQALQDAGIEPYVTLHHFVHPQWFDDIGGFEKVENIDRFVAHSLTMMKEFSTVKNWMTFNEPGIYGFQSRMRGVYPPGFNGDIASHGRVVRGLLMAHCKVYQAAQVAKAAGAIRSDAQIGVTHQWLKMVPHSGNFIEKIACYFVSKMTHYAVYNFFKTGRFEMDIPFMSNVSFEIPKEEFEKNDQFMDFIGVQFYGFPQLKVGLNSGKPFPGYQIKNYILGKFGITTGATCQRGGKVLSFGPAFSPETLLPCLTEAAALRKPIVISETGCDARIWKEGEASWATDESTQREYFQKIGSILAQFKDQMKAFFVWTAIRGHLEWDRGGFPQLGLIPLQKDANRQILGYTLPPAALYLQKAWNPAQQTAEASA